MANKEGARARNIGAAESRMKNTSATVCVVIPTYNENENIGKLIPQLCSAFEKNSINGSILVVDDNSPDGTGQAAEELSKKYPVSVLHKEEKAGIGAAYIAGFKECLANGSDIICEMDADLSHDPKYFPAIIKGLESADLVLGSRYIPGGGTVNWGTYRKMVSGNANRLVRLMTGIKINDTTGGYRAYRAEVLRAIDIQNIRSNGYEFQIEMLYKTLKAGFTVKEVPIIFREREEGVSKLSRKEVAKFFLFCTKTGILRLLGKK